MEGGRISGRISSRDCVVVTKILTMVRRTLRKETAATTLPTATTSAGMGLLLQELAALMRSYLKGIRQRVQASIVNKAYQSNAGSREH